MFLPIITPFRKVGTRAFAAASVTALFALSAVSARPAQAQTTLLTQNFDTFVTGTTTDYYTFNTSTNANSSVSWQQPDATTVANTFSAYNGSSTSYLYSNYEAISSGSGTISTWLVTPTLNYQNGDVFSFYTRTTGFTPIYPDRLQVRLSTNGTSTNVGTSPTDVGDFSSMLLEINPNQTTTGYPTAWTQYSVTISGLTTTTAARIALRYYVTDAGPDGTNGDFVGVDALSVLRSGTTNTPEPSSLGLLLLGGLPLIGIARRHRRAASFEPAV